MTDDRHIREALLAAQDGLAGQQPPGPHWAGAVRHGIAARRRKQRAAAAGLASLLALAGAGAVYAVSGTDRDDNLVAVTPTESATPTTEPTELPSTEPTEAPTPTAPPPPPPPTPDVCAPAFPANTLRDTATPSGRQLGIAGAVAGPQDDYDRVVFNLGGDGGEPGWSVEYVDDPRSDGSGNPVAVDGSATLQVVIENIGTPYDTGVPYPDARRLSPGDTEVVQEVVMDSVFEGYFTAFIGTSAELPFRVFKLDDPAQLVVDVRHC